MEGVEQISPGDRAAPLDDGRRSPLGEPRQDLSIGSIATGTLKSIIEEGYEVRDLTKTLIRNVHSKVPNMPRVSLSDIVEVSTGWSPRVNPNQRASRRTYTISMPNACTGAPETMSVQHDYSCQHTLTWQTVNMGVDGTVDCVLPGGLCNLFQFPKVQREGHSLIDRAPLTGNAFKLFELLVFTLATDEMHFMYSKDASGALPFLAILVANSDAALRMTTRILQARPELMPIGHAPGTLYEGETLLHVLAVNRREDELCHLIELAVNKLDDAQLEALLTSQAVGAFFDDEPMKHYGGTALNYCIAFSLHRALVCMMLLSLQRPKMVDFVDPNSTHLACKSTGFLPVHVAVANDLTRMYDFITHLPGLPQLRHLRAERLQLSVSAPWGPTGQLAPLQLATFTGNHRMFQHIMRARAIVLFQWGPVTQYRVSLDGIDSIGLSDNDVMNLVARSDASSATRHMLGEELMLGFLHDLFIQKWNDFGRTTYILQQLLELLVILALSVTAFHAKLMPESAHEAQWVFFTLWGPAMFFSSMLPILLIDSYLLVMYGRSVSFSLHLIWSYANMHKMVGKWVALMMASAGNVYLLHGGIVARSQDDPGAFLQVQLSYVWVLFALPLLRLISDFAQNMLAPLSGLGRFYIIVDRMLEHDVTQFLIIFIIYIVDCGVAMWLMAPRYVMDSSLGDGRWSFLAMTQELLMLGLIGTELPVSVSDEFHNKQGHYIDKPADLFNLGVFSLLYGYFAVMTLILLLNLLIAMMGQTFQETMEVAHIEWRLAFARRVLLYETLAQLPPCWARQAHGPKSFLGLFDLHAGIRAAGSQGQDYYVEFRNVDANSEGSGGKVSAFGADDEATEPAAVVPLPPLRRKRAETPTQKPAFQRANASSTLHKINPGGPSPADAASCDRSEPPRTQQRTMKPLVIAMRALSRGNSSTGEDRALESRTLVIEPSRTPRVPTRQLSVADHVMNLASLGQEPEDTTFTNCDVIEEDGNRQAVTVALKRASSFRQAPVLPNQGGLKSGPRSGLR